MGTRICRKKNSALPSIIYVALIFLGVSSSESLSSSTDTISHTSTYPSVDESNATRNYADSNDIPGILRDSTLKENSFQKSSYQQSYSDDNSGDVTENYVDFKIDDSDANHDVSQLLNSKIRKATMRFLHKRPWFHSWSGRKREDDLDWKYPEEENDRRSKLSKPEHKESYFGDVSQSTNAMSLHKIKRGNSRPRGNSFTAPQLGQSLSHSGKIKSKSIKTKHISKNKFKYTKINADQLVKTKAGYLEVVSTKGEKSRLKRSASVIPLDNELYLQLNYGEKIDNEVPENIPPIHKDEIKLLDNSLEDPGIGLQPSHGIPNLKDSLETKNTVEVINDCFELLKGPNCILLMNDVMNDISRKTNAPPEPSLDNAQEDNEISYDLIATGPNEHAWSSGTVDSIRSSDSDDNRLDNDPESLSESEKGVLAESDSLNKAQLENTTALVKVVENALTESTKLRESEMLKNTDSLLASSDESSIKDQEFGFMLPMNPPMYAYKHLQASESDRNYKSNPMRMGYANELNGGIPNLLIASSSRPFHDFKTQASTPDNGFQAGKIDKFFPNSDESRSYVGFLKMLSERDEMPRNVWEGREFNARRQFPGSSFNEHHSNDSNSQYSLRGFFQGNPVAQKLLELQGDNGAFIFKRPSFHSWSGKRNANKEITYKRPSFHSWSGKRDGYQNVVSKRPSFHSWSGKRNGNPNVNTKRPSFHSWSGKRDVSEIAKSIKRPSFHSWSGKRNTNKEITYKRPSFHSWSGKREGNENIISKRPSFHSWSGKRNAIKEITYKRPSFHSWSGKRDGNPTVNTKRPSFHSWSGKRNASKDITYKRPSFHSWSGKRDGNQNGISKRPSFQPWSGKR